MGSGRQGKPGLHAAVSALAVLVLLAPGVGAAPYLQHGVDAGRVGFTTDPGPLWPDIAFSIELPGERINEAPTLVFDRAAFVLTRAAGRTAGPEQTGIWRVDLDTAEPRLLVDLQDEGEFVSSLSSDGERLFVTLRDRVQAYDAETGAAIWAQAVAYPVVVDEEVHWTRCAPGAVDEGVLVLGCLQMARRARAWASSPEQDKPVVLAIEATGGELLWSWQPNPVRSAGADVLDVNPRTTYSSVVGVNIHGEHVVVQVDEFDHLHDEPCTLVPGAAQVYDYGFAHFLYGLDRRTGGQAWETPIPAHSFTSTRRPLHAAYRPVVNAIGEDGAVAGTRDRLFALNTGPLTEFELASGCWADTFDPENPEPALGPETDVSSHLQGIGGTFASLALVGGDVVLIKGFSIYRITEATATVAWEQPLSSSTPGGPDGLVVTGETVFLTRRGGDLVEAREPDDGTLRWSVDLSRRLDDEAFLNNTAQNMTSFDVNTSLPRAAVSVGEGVLVHTSAAAGVTVIGTTAASIVVEPAVPEGPLAQGEAFVLDLSGSRPGRLAPTTEYAVDWGDGTADTWAPQSRWEHAYESDGERVVVVQARNDAGQTSRTSFTVMVGGDADAGPLTAARNAFTGDSALFVWPFVVLAAIAGVVAVGYGRQARHERARSDATTLPAPSQDATKVYREALFHALGEDGTITDKDAAMLAGLRAQLGITERDHALLVHAILTGGGDAGGLVLEPGQSVLGKYEVRQLLGEGGHGLTYHARDTVLERDVVVKVLHTGTLSADDLLDEARAMGRVRHANVVTVHDVDRVGDQVFLVMEHMAGGGLDDALGDGSLDRARFAALAGDLLRALAAVHRAGLVHRDVKPANILFDEDGSAKLADFGIVHTPGLEATMAAFQTIEQAIGTIPYMSPEQARGRPADGRSDLYSAALVLYEAYTGQRYFVQAEDEFVAELQMRVARGDAPGLNAIGDEALREWLARALAPDPEDRFSTAHEMARALDEVLDR